MYVFTPTFRYDLIHPVKQFIEITIPNTQVSSSPMNREIHYGDGFLAGEVPNVVTEEGVPTEADILICLRNTGDVVRTTRSAQDGTWRADGLNADKRYDVIMRKDTYNDLIVSDVTPIAPPLIRNRTIRIVNGTLNLDIPLDFYGGEGAIVAAMVGGSLPFTVALHENHLVSGEVNAEVGDYTVTLELTSGRYTVTQNITIEVRSTPLRLSVVGLEEWYENESTITPVEVTVTGGRKPYTVTTDLPEGLTYSDGEISGTLDEDVSDMRSRVVITVTDADGTVRGRQQLVVITNGIVSKNVNLAANKPWSTDGSHTTQNASSDVTNGILSTSNYVTVGTSSFDPTRAYCIVDLEDVYLVNEIRVWMYWQDSRYYNGMKIDVSTDGIEWRTVTVGTSGNSAAGKTFKIQLDAFRYFRVGSTGNTVNSGIHFIELQAWFT